MIDILNTRRSVRKFLPDAVPDRDLEAILEAAMNAPSAMNEQAWQFVVLTGEVLDGFLAINRNTPKGAPVGILVCGDLSKSQDSYYVQDCSAATQNILLAAHALGYGSVWTTVFAPAVEPIRQLLALPEHVVPFAFAPIGRPQKTPASATRFSAARVHRNGW